MSARAAFTEHQLRRVMRAAKKEGYQIGGVKPDGTVLVYVGDERPEGLSIVPPPEQAEEGKEWDV
jgi:hypothetical protein